MVEFRCAREMICNAIQAEREGYDAFIVGHFQNAGPYEARAAVDTPVINGIPIAVKMAEMAVSRTGDYVKAPGHVIEEFLMYPKGL